jgi:hypothetical protein
MVTGELLEELPGDAAEECVGTNTAHKHQRNRDQRAADFLHGLQRGVAPAQATREMPLDIFDHHDGVVDHDADREHEAEQREIVDREPSAAITAKVPTSDTGMAMIGMIAGRQPCRNTSTTMTTSSIAS